MIISYVERVVAQGQRGLKKSLTQLQKHSHEKEIVHKRRPMKKPDVMKKKGQKKNSYEKENESHSAKKSLEKDSRKRVPLRHEEEPQSKRVVKKSSTQLLVIPCSVLQCIAVRCSALRCAAV